MNPHVIAGLLTLAACYVILCRVSKMTQGRTKPTVFIQHGLLAMSLFCSVILDFTSYEDWSQACMACGLLAFFTLSMRRWKTGAPDGTTKPALMRYDDLIHVQGGKK